MPNQHLQHQTPDLADRLAAKPFFKIGEVAKLLGVKPHVLRYWESEFPTLRPKKNPSGQRIYAKADVETLVEIQNLLYNERYTIPGARQMLAHQGSGAAAGAVTHDTTTKQVLARLKTHVYELLALLSHMPTS